MIEEPANYKPIALISHSTLMMAGCRRQRFGGMSIRGTGHILQNCPETLLRSIGGIAYKRLLSHYRKIKIEQTELENLKILSEKYIGYWQKLYSKLSIPAPQ